LQKRETIRALILAAGLSRRMGEFKPLLPLRGATLIESSVGSVLAGGAETATVVTGYRAGDVERVLSRAFGERVCFARNEAYAETDMMRSIRIGAAALPACDAFFLLPGDMPVVSRETFCKLLASRRQAATGVIFPTLNGYRKHPPLIDARLIPAILAFDGGGGLRELWKRYEGEARDVPVDDAGVWIDVDTPDDYLQCRQNYDESYKSEKGGLIEDGKNQ
jgi:CTP:molybdopterin cytidylyltransferase MocA